MTTLQEIYEQEDTRRLAYRIIIAGADFTQRVNSFNYGFANGEAPTATINLSKDLLTDAIAEESAVEIWLGFQVGLVHIQKMVFGGGIINSVSRHGTEVNVECIQDGPRRINFTYYRRIDYEFDNKTAQESLEALLTLAGVTNWYVNVVPWDIGTAVPQTIQFSTYAEAINKISTVDGMEWYALPTGQIRVESRDPLPYDNSRRIYYSSHLVGTHESQSVEVTGRGVSSNARPRNLDVSASYDRPGVGNWVEVDGAVLVTLGPNGEQNSDQIIEFVDGAPGHFDNGAPWITTPPLFQQFSFSNELIDTNAKAFEVAERYYALKNRLIQNVTITVPADPDVFLNETVRVIDENTDTDELYCVVGYRTNISSSEAITELTLQGGHYSGTQGFASPFAEFTWTHEVLYNQLGGSGNNSVADGNCSDNAAALALGWQSGLGAKLCQDLPEDTGSSDQGGGKPGPVTAQVFIGLNGTPSEDFDGQVVSWAWSDNLGHTGSGPRVTFIYDPATASTVEVTLTVTDDTARTDTITKTVYLKANYNTPSDPSLNDTPAGGGEAQGACTEDGDPEHGDGDQPGGHGMSLIHAVAADCKAMMTANNQDWNMLDKDDLSVGNFISVAAKNKYGTQETIALFGTDNGQIMRTTDGAQSGTVTHRGSTQNERITSIAFDPKDCGTAIAFTSLGQVLTSDDDGSTWTQIKPKDGIPINKTMFIDGKLYAFGGDTGDPDTLIRVSKDGGASFDPVRLTGDLYRAVQSAGPGGTITAASRNAQGLTIGFKGVSGLAWTTTDITKPDWSEVSGLSGTQVTAMAPGHDSDSIISTDDGTFTTDDNETFTPACPTVQDDIAWEGLPGVYIGVSEGSINKIVGNTCGPMMPNAGFPDQTPFPGCARPRKHAVVIGPYPPAGGGWPAIVAPARADVSSLALVGAGSSIVSTNGGVIFAFHAGVATQPDPSSIHIGSWIPILDVDMNAAIAPHPGAPCFDFTGVGAAVSRVFAGVVPPGSNFTYDGSGYSVEVFADNADTTDPVNQTAQGGPDSVYTGVDFLSLSIATIAATSRLLAFLNEQFCTSPALTGGGAVSPMSGFDYVAQGALGVGGSWGYTKDNQSSCHSDYDIITWGAFGFEVQGRLI
jgi:hypothetical protein